MILEIGDCLPYLLAGAFHKRNAWICAPPANIAFMGRKWDRHAAHAEFVPYIKPRSSAHLRELQSEHAFKTYWGERFAAMYDASEDDAIAIIWAMPRTINLTMDALKAAGWQVFDVINHAFGTGWNKNGALLKPAHEPWILARKGKGRLNTEACRVPRGGNEHHRGAVAESNKSRNTYSNHGSFEPTNSPGGSCAANLVISHHEGCARIGERKVKASNAVGGSDAHNVLYGKHDRKRVGSDYAANGSESIPSFACVAGCDRCGSWWTEPEGASPSACACGGEGAWACPVARLNEESKIRGTHSAGRATGGKLYSPESDQSIQSVYGPRSEQVVCSRHVDTENGSSAARFFNTFTSLVYAGKSSGRIDAEGVPSGERHAGCEELYWSANRENPFGFDRVTRAEWEGLETDKRARGNVHPTVKGLDLLMHLVKLSGGDKIGDICAGSGGMAIACQLLGLDFWGAELCPEAVEITRARLAFWESLNDAERVRVVHGDKLAKVIAARDKRMKKECSDGAH